MNVNDFRGEHGSGYVGLASGHDRVVKNSTRNRTELPYKPIGLGWRVGLGIAIP